VLGWNNLRSFGGSVQQNETSKKNHMPLQFSLENNKNMLCNSALMTLAAESFKQWFLPSGKLT